LENSTSRAFGLSGGLPTFIFLPGSEKRSLLPSLENILNSRQIVATLIMQFISTTSLSLLIFLAANLASAQSPMQLLSDSISDGKIQKQHACRDMGGKDVSPQLTVTQAPEDAQFLSVVMDDPDAIPVAGKNWVHWNVFNVPIKGGLNLPAGALLQEEKGKASGGSRSYEGMCPPNGSHTYRIAVFATKTKLDVAAVATRTPMTIESFESKFGSLILSKAQLAAKF
jgi:Raf kinase inhibitor-like YbhB/YbcL family protein